MIVTKYFSSLAKVLAGLLLGVITLSVFGYLLALPRSTVTWGLNYSSLRAKDLNFEPVPLLNTILTDLKPKTIRLPAYWSELEPQQGQFNFMMIDSLLAQADAHGTRVILVVGLKQPRWPECHNPDWWDALPTTEQKDQAVLDMITATVNHLKDSPVITMWQVENEPFFEYGPDCPTINRQLYRKELEAVRKIDSRPIVGTDSGEKGIWLTTAWSGVDVFGATMYREVYEDKKQRYRTYPLPAWTYNVKAGIVRLLSGANETIGVELQAEPWFAGSDAQHTSKEEQLLHMNADILHRNADYARDAGFAENYFWGAEWWYWMKVNQQDNSLVEAARQIFSE